MKIRAPFALSVLFLFNSALGQERGSPSKITVCENLLRTGQMDAALVCYRQALETDPDDPGLNLKVCQILEATGRVDQIGPYLNRIDESSKETGDFTDMLSANYGTLTIVCEGSVECPRYFKAKTNLKFTPPEELEPAKSIRLASLNGAFGDRGTLWFRRETENRSVARIDYFPIIVGAPLPYDVEILRSNYQFNFNFVELANLAITTKDLYDIQCAIPDTMAQVQIEIDDSDYEAALAFESHAIAEQGRYFVARGDASTLTFQKRGRPTINKKYLMITSVVLTTAVLLFQR
jgi:tetratricopeptide (TPR) repeat protein